MARKQYKGKRPRISEGFNLPGNINLKADSIIGMFEEVKDCGCAGFSCCPYPHYYMRDSKGAMNAWIDKDTDPANPVWVFGDDVALKTFFDALPE